MYGYLKKPYKTNKKDFIYKIMIHEIKNEGIFAYLYTSHDAIFSSFDYYYTDLADALEEWKNELDEQGWIKIDDPLPDCQHDCILPIRVKGRNEGNPQWGQYEVLQDGKWISYII